MPHTWVIKLFAGLPERLGTTVVRLEEEAGELTAAQLKARIAAAYPGHDALLQSAFVASNHAYAADGELLLPSDELALLPPVSGGEDRDGVPSADMSAEERYVVTENAISSDEVLSKVIVEAHGASIAFVGTTREWTQGQRTVHLEYEAYAPMAEAMMRTIGDEIEVRWSGALCAITHRIGRVGLAETSVVIAVSAPHREACYEASRYAIERLKQIVPIWKKEIWEDGSEWKGHQQGPWNPTALLPNE